MKAKPNPYPSQTADANVGIGKVQNDNVSRFTTPNYNSTNMGITNIVNAHRAKRKMEKVAVIAEGVMLGSMREDEMQAKKITLRK